MGVFARATPTETHETQRMKDMMGCAFVDADTHEHTHVQESQTFAPQRERERKRDGKMEQIVNLEPNESIELVMLGQRFVDGRLTPRTVEGLAPKSRQKRQAKRTTDRRAQGKYGLVLTASIQMDVFRRGEKQCVRRSHTYKTVHTRVQRSVWRSGQSNIKSYY